MSTATTDLFKFLKNESSHIFQSGHSVFTPETLVNELLSKLDDLPNKKIMVLFNVEFVVSLVYTYKVNPVNITFYSDHLLKNDFIKHTGNINIIQDLENVEMKFDVIVGNPPYQDSQHGAKKNSLWKKFLDKAVTLSDTVAFVIPASFAAPAPTFNKYKKKISYINFDVKKYFPKIGSSFCSIILHKNLQNYCTVQTKTENFIINLDKYDCLPETVSSDLLNKVSTIFKNNRAWQRTCEYHTQKISLFNNGGKYEVIHGSVSKHTNVDHPNNKLIRVFCPTTTYPIFRICKDKGLSHNQVWTECKSLEEAEELCKYLNSDSVQNVLRHYKWSNMYYPQTISQLGI